MNTQSLTLDEHGNHDDSVYEGFRCRVQSRFRSNILDGKFPLFTTDATGLFAAYLAAFPEAERQHHNCNTCRHFIERYCGLVTIDNDGRTTPAILNEEDAPEGYRAAVAAVLKIVRAARVNGVFLASLQLWGNPVTGVWRHMAVVPPSEHIFKGLTQTAGQARAEKREDFKNVSRALAEFPLATIEVAMKLLETESLYRSEKVIGPARWLQELHAARNAANGYHAKANLTWRAVAKAPAGFCHPRSSMIGTLLDDIAAGLAFADVSRRFAAKMRPDQYQRPQAAPAAGTIAQAEKVVEQLGIARSLLRRFARLDEIPTIWTPRPPKDAAPAAGGGVFAHLKPKGAAAEIPDMSIPPIVMTWEKFFRTVLHDVEAIEFYARDQSDTYAALVTAVHADAPPILQWDREDRRNPVSSYQWTRGSRPEQWGLKPRCFHSVSAITFSPWMWGDHTYEHMGTGVLFLLEQARESVFNTLALFPETLRSELHGVRSVIEAYSKDATLEGSADGNACGIQLSKGREWKQLFRVQVKGRPVHYLLDRWD